ncbi:hypothetical protein HDU83_009597, partial [Entophlyctis luteolus]
KTYVVHATGLDASFDCVILYDISQNHKANIECMDRFSCIQLQEANLIMSDKTNKKVEIHNIGTLIFKLDTPALDSYCWDNSCQMMSNIIEPANVVNTCVTVDGKLFVLYESSDKKPTVDIWDLQSPSIAKIVQVPNAASLLVSRDPRCDMRVSVSGTRMLISSSASNTIAWWDLEDIESPRMVRDVPESIQLSACIHPELEHVVISDVNRLLKHMKYSELSDPVTENRGESRFSSAVDSVALNGSKQQEYLYTSDNEDEFGFSHIFLDVADTEQLKAVAIDFYFIKILFLIDWQDEHISHVLKHSENTTCMSMAEVAGRSWLIAYSSYHECLSAWDLDSTAAPTDSVPVKKIFAYSLISAIDSAKTDSGIIIAIGSDHGETAVISIKDGKFLMPPALYIPANMPKAFVAELYLSLQENVLVIRSTNETSTRSNIRTLYWKESLDKMKDQLDAIENDSVLKWPVCGESESVRPFGIVHLGAHGGHGDGCACVVHHPLQ